MLNKLLTMYVVVIIISLVLSIAYCDVLQYVNYRSIVGRVVDMDGSKYSVTPQRFPCIKNSSLPSFTTIFVADPELRCSCFGNCSMPTDCYAIINKRIGSSSIIIGTSLSNVRNTSYTFRDPEKLYIFEPHMDYTYSPTPVNVYCFSDMEYGAVISDDSFRYLFSKQRFTFSYFKDRVMVNFVSRDYLYRTIRDQFVPDVELDFGQDFVYSCFNSTQKFNRFPPYDCSKPFIVSDSKFRCDNYVLNNNCPDNYAVNTGSNIYSTIVLPFVSYDGETVTPDYLSNKFIPNYMHGLKGIFPDVFGWLSDELNKLFRVLGNLLLDSLGYIFDRIISQIYAMLPLLEEFIDITIRFIRYIFVALVKIIITVEKQIFLSEYLVLYLVTAYYMNLELAPLVFLVLVILVFGITRWFPSLLLILLNGEFRTDLATV